MAAAAASIIASRLRRDKPASFIPSLAAAEVSRSSKSRMGGGAKGARLRTKARVDCALEPSDPSMFNGRPRTSAAMCSLSTSAISSAASWRNFVRWIVESGVAMPTSSVPVARPIVLAPRSSPSKRDRSVSSGASSSGSVVISMGRHTIACFLRHRRLQLRRRR